MRIFILKYVLLSALTFIGVPNVDLSISIDQHRDVSIETSFSIQTVSAQTHVAFRQQTQQELFSNRVFVLFFIGQSNSVGRATAAQEVTCLSEPSSPSNVKIYYKPDYTNSDNGSFVSPTEGGIYTSEPDAGATGMTGAYLMVASRIAALSPNPVYIIMVGDGGTALKQGLTTPDWAPSTVNGDFDVALNRYFIPAIPKIVAANPGKTLQVAIDWMQGETDATDATATSQYGTNLAAFFTALRAKHALLNNCLLTITHLNFNQTANESTINSAFDTYAATDATHIKICDVSSYPRKQDLTSGQKCGQADAGSLDQHFSHIAQQQRAIQIFNYIKSAYIP